MKRLMLTMTMASLFFACCDGPESGKYSVNNVFTRSFVMDYVDVEDIHLSRDHGEGPLEIGILYTSSGIVDGSYNSRNKATRAYDALCEKHGDMTFNRTVQLNEVIPVPTYPAVDFVSISVTSDADYDAEHPAGASLKDLITAKYNTAKPYIDSGYTEYDEILGLPSTIKYSTITKDLSDVSAGDLVLLGDGHSGNRLRDLIYRLIFERQPTLSKTHNFTVTMTADDGRVFSDTIEMNFE